MAHHWPVHASSVSVYMQQRLEEYNRLRGILVREASVFWDAVIISAADAEQKSAFQYQIEKKLSRGELPLGIPYLVIDDPTGPAIGNGGSTLHVLNELNQLFQEKFTTMRILLIHAGGSSKRLPSASVLGKLFISLPFEGKPKPYQMLDLKLALYLPFLKRMAAGVFVTCSDDIETYDLADCDGEGDLGNWSFDQVGFTALAHKSDIETGKHHGVYVLPAVEFSEEKSFTFGPCLEVLQKPSEDLMQKKEAIIEGSEVCTDSVFFFTHDVSAKLIEFYVKNSPLHCEVDAYHDFLQALGSRADLSYIHRENCTSDRLVSLREQLFDLLNGTALNVLLLHKSYFYHLGTCIEYIDNLSSNSNLFHELGMTPFVQNKILDADVTELSALPELCSTATIMCSVITSSLCCRRPAVIEYSRLEANMLIGEYCLLSNCHVVSESILHVPPHCVMHTVAVKMSSMSGFVTIAFGVHDDLKKSKPFVESGDLVLFGQKLKDLTHIFDIQEIFPFQGKCSLWTGRFFTLCSTMTESFLTTLGDIQAIHQLQNMPRQGINTCQLSMAEVVQHKDIEETLNFRDQFPTITNPCIS